MSYHNAASTTTRTQQSPPASIRSRQSIPASTRANPPPPTSTRATPPPPTSTPASLVPVTGLTVPNPKDLIVQTPLMNAPRLTAAPNGYHYMPDGTLMSDGAMLMYEDKYTVLQKGKLSAEKGFKNLKSFSIETHDIPQSGDSRNFSISGDIGAIFTLEVKNEDNYYYNFKTKLFQVEKHVLKNIKLTSLTYSSSIDFPTVTDADTYEFSLHVDYANTRHTDHIEVRRADGSYDTNLSTGSNSALLKRIVYQTLDKTVNISSFSPIGMTGLAVSTQVLSIPASQSLPKIPFSITATAASTKAFQINKNPSNEDTMVFVSREIGSAPIAIPGEDIYPTATTAFTGDDVNGAVTSGAVVRMDNTDLSAVIKVGDKITTPVTTDTVNGAVEEGVNIVMDAAVASKMAVGDQVTGKIGFDNAVITVAGINIGGNANKFALSTAVAVGDGETLTFSSKINRSLTTVTVVETSSTATDFTMSQAIQFRDNCPLTFFNQRNHSWPLDSTTGIMTGMRVVSDTQFIEGLTFVSGYQEIITSNEGTTEEVKHIVSQKAPVDNRGEKPTILTNATSNITTIVQPGDVTFNNPALLLFAGETVKMYSYGVDMIKATTGYDVSLTDMEVVLTPITTTTTSAVSASTSIPISSRNGILNNQSSISGIGIDPSVADPLVTAGATGNAGAGTITAATAQTLEDGVTLTFPNAGSVATITGSITINNVGNEDITIRLDLDKFLSYA